MLLTRRKILGALAAAPLGHLIGCGTESAGSGTDGGAIPGVDAGKGAAADGALEAAGDAATAADGGAWASGGTAAITGNYPDPFAAGIGTTCDLTCSATLGPCYVPTVTRKDISERRSPRRSARRAGRDVTRQSRTKRNRGRSAELGVLPRYERDTRRGAYWIRPATVVFSSSALPILVVTKRLLLSAPPNEIELGSPSMRVCGTFAVAPP